MSIYNKKEWKMKEHKLFKPDLMFSNYKSASWCKGIEAINNTKIPINSFLVEKRGIFALDIKPIGEETSYYWAIPIDRSWTPQTFTDDLDVSLEIYTEQSLSLTICLTDENGKNLSFNKINITSDDLDQWTLVNFTIPLDKAQNARTITFTGCIENTSNYLVKNLIIEE